MGLQMKLGMGRPMKIFVGIVVVIGLLFTGLYALQWFKDSDGRKIEKLARQIAEQTGGGYEIDPLVSCGIENRRICPSTQLSKSLSIQDPELQTFELEQKLLAVEDIEKLAVNCQGMEKEKICDGTYRSKTNNYIINTQIRKSNSTETNFLTIYVQKDN